MAKQRKRYRKPPPEISPENPKDFICSWGRHKGKKLSEINDLRFLKVLLTLTIPEWKAVLVEERITQLKNETSTN